MSPRIRSKAEVPQGSKENILNHISEKKDLNLEYVKNA